MFREEPPVLTLAPHYPLCYVRASPMSERKPYIMNILIHPQASTREREEIEATVRSWAEEHHGTVEAVTHEQKRHLAYPIQHVHQATYTTIRLGLPAQELTDLQEKLWRQKKVLRCRIFQQAPRATERTLKDVPARAAAEPVKAALPLMPKKPKASIEKLDEKIEEILEEEVL